MIYLLVKLLNSLLKYKIHKIKNEKKKINQKQEESIELKEKKNE
jgi:hypothetical protein